MKQKITSKPQRITIHKINPTEQEINGELTSDHSAHRHSISGNFFIINNILIVENDDNEVIGVFSLDQYYFEKSNL